VCRISSHFALDSMLLISISVVRNSSVSNLLNFTAFMQQKNYTNYPSAAHPLEQLAAYRKRYVCADCLPDTVEYCECTLRKRFVDRWACIRCITRECAHDAEYAKKHLCSETLGMTDGELQASRLEAVCECGKAIARSKLRVLCSWCGGKVLYRQGPVRLLGGA
jgi:hypothetical protein